MSRAKPFSSWLAPHFQRFVMLKRACGASYTSGERLLLAFDRHLCVNAPRPPLGRETVIEYFVSRTWSPRAQGNVASVVWQGLGHARRHGARVDLLPERPPMPPRYWRQRQPRIVSVAEIADLIAAARRLPPLDILRPATMATLLGLLYATGMRIGEALALDIGHLDRRDGILTVVRGKFAKSRALPLCPSTVHALVRYIEDPRRPLGTQAANPLFVSGLGRRLAQPTVHAAFKAVCRKADLPQPWPRRHDLRHTFAVHRVAAWYAQGRSVDSLLPVLSTYLGHSTVENTRLYLTENGALLEQAGARFERQTTALDEVSA